MSDKLRKVRISVVNKDTRTPDPVNVVTSAESVLLDGTNVNIKDYVDDKVRNAQSGPLTDVASGKVVDELKDELTTISGKIDTLPEKVSASVNSEEITALRNKVSDISANFSAIALKDNLSMTKDEAGHLRTKMDEAIAKIAVIEEQIANLPVSRQGALEVELETLKSTTNDLKVKMAALKVQDKITMTTEEANALRTKIDQVTIDTAKIKETVTSLPTAELANVKSTIDTIQERLKSLPTEISGTNFATSQEYTTLKASVDELKNRVNGLQTSGTGSSVDSVEIATIKSTISELQTKVGAIKLQESVTISKDEANALRTKVDDLLVRVSNIGSGSSSTPASGERASVSSTELETLKSSVNDLQRKVTELQNGASADISTEFAKLKSNFETVKSQVEVLKLPSTITMTKEEAKALRDKVDEAIAASTTIKEKIKTLPDELNNANTSEIGSLKNRLSTIETTVGNIPSNVSSDITEVKEKQRTLETNMSVLEAKLPTSFAVTKDEVNFIRTRTEGLLTTVSKLEAQSKILPDYSDIIKKDTNFVDLKNSVTDTIARLNSLKQAFDKTYPVTPLVVSTEKKIISFRKSIPVQETITYSAPKELIVELPQYSEFLDINLSASFGFAGFSQWDYRILSVIVDNNVDEDLDTGVKNEKLYYWTFNSSGGEKFISMYGGFRVLPGITHLRIKITINSNSLSVYSPYDFVNKVFAVYGSGV
jgi:hypothetical protein|nr:MAG TPA: coiled-coil domain-containing protein [Caudoviricetes sp.]